MITLKYEADEKGRILAIYSCNVPNTELDTAFLNISKDYRGSCSERYLFLKPETNKLEKIWSGLNIQKLTKLVELINKHYVYKIRLIRTSGFVGSIE